MLTEPGQVGKKIGHGAVICMAETMLPLDEHHTAVPVSSL